MNHETDFVLYPLQSGTQNVVVVLTSNSEDPLYYRIERNAYCGKDSVVKERVYI